MSYIPGTKIPQNMPFNQLATPQGSYNNPFTPGSIEYDAYKQANIISQNVANAKDNFTTTTNAIGGAVKDAVQGISDVTNGSTIDTTGMYTLYDPNSASGSPGSMQQLQYIDAPYAEHYGMDVNTAYQEALANTAYQRKVNDLKAAGLNPVLGISGSGADSFYGTSAASSGGSGYGSLGSAKGTAAETATKLSYWLPTLVNGVTNMAVSLGTKNSMNGYAAGMVAQNVVAGALGAIRNHT